MGVVSQFHPASCLRALQSNLPRQTATGMLLIFVAADELVASYVARHAMSDIITSVRRDPCAHRFISADFLGRGLANSVNTPLNALAWGVATNRTLLVADDAKFNRLGFWKYLGDLRWPRKSAVLAAFREAGGCSRCGCSVDEVVRDFFPMNQDCLHRDRCGDGVGWLLCDDALGRKDAPFVHVKGAISWLAPIALARETPLGDLGALFRAGDTWGALFDGLMSRRPGHALSRVFDAKLPPSGRFDVGIHIRHRRNQP